MIQYDSNHMGNLNKIISLIIGLVTVVVFFAVLTGRINLNNKLPRLNSINKTVAPTPTINKQKTQTKNPTPTLSYKVNQYQSQKGASNNPSQIPTTGPSPLFYQALFLTLTAGIYLRGKR